MYKIAILGTENSHARAFCNIIYKGHNLLGGIPYADFEVIGLCGDNAEENQRLKEITGGRAEISDDPAAWVGKVDAVMVTARHGAKHFRFAKPYIESGVPVFVDKPITIDCKEAIQLVELAKKHNVPLCGGSMCGFVDGTQSVKRIMSSRLTKVFGGSVSAPVRLENEYGNFFFYSQHLVQIMCEIFGYDIEEIQAVRREDAVTFLARYKDYDVTGHYGTEHYSATVYGREDVIHRNIDITTDGYATEFRQFEHMVRTGKMIQSYDNFIRPVFILDAIHTAMETGKTVKLEYPTV